MWEGGNGRREESEGGRECGRECTCHKVTNLLKDKVLRRQTHVEKVLKEIIVPSLSCVTGICNTATHRFWKSRVLS